VPELGAAAMGEGPLTKAYSYRGGNPRAAPTER
jgi:hypothetical protein